MVLIQLGLLLCSIVCISFGVIVNLQWNFLLGIGFCIVFFGKFKIMVLGLMVSLIGYLMLLQILLFCSMIGLNRVCSGCSSGLLVVVVQLVFCVVSIGVIWLVQLVMYVVLLVVKMVLICLVGSGWCNEFRVVLVKFVVELGIISSLLFWLCVCI